MSKVSVTHNTSYDFNEVYSSVCRHFELLNIASNLKSDAKIVIKPNLLMKRKPDENTTTHPNLVSAIAKGLKELGFTNITIAESPGGPYTPIALKPIFSACGMEDVAKEQQININYDVGFRPVANPNGVVCREFNIIDPIADADFIISVAKLKTHCMTGLSGGVKNLFGCVPGLMKPEFHWRFPDKNQFCNMLVDLCETVKPDVTFVDAIMSMEGDGPSGGTSRKTDMIFASDNPYDLDVVLCKVINTPCEDVYTVKNAIERGLSKQNFDEVELLGDELLVYEDFKKPTSHTVDFSSHTPKFIQSTVKFISKKLLTPKPKIDLKKCVGCGKCAESCPAKTINITDTGKGKKAIINYDACIKCFCCHEMCPIKVISVKRFNIFKHM